MKYRLGLDIGITSVGWAVIEHDEQENPVRICDLGVRIFPAAEAPKDGASLATPRRQARSQRRRLHRRKHRKERLYKLLEQCGVMDETTAKSMFACGGFACDPYQLRAEGLDRPLNAKEWVRVLVHIFQRRGFKSNRKAEVQESSRDKEGKQLLGAVSENAALMREKGYRTVGEMMCLDPKFNAGEECNRIRRNKEGQYAFTVARDQLRDELIALFQAQRAFETPHASERLERQVLEIFLSQRSFDEGPGAPSPYAGNQIEKMVRFCTFEPDQYRAAKACYTFETFNLLQRINSIRLIGPGNERELTKIERESLRALAHDMDELKFNVIRKKLQISPEYRFNLVNYNRTEQADECEKKEKFQYLPCFHAMRKALEPVGKGRILTIDLQTRDMAAEILTLFKGDDARRKRLAAIGMRGADIEALLSLSFSGYARLSLKAMHNILPHLEQGLKYNEACEVAGYDFKGHDRSQKLMLLPANPDDAPELADIANPVVQRAVSQTIKVVNAVIRKYGSPQRITVELARDMGKSFEDRNEIKKSQELNAARNENIRNRLVNEFNVPFPKGEDILKLRLFEEQNELCLYSGKPFTSAVSIFQPGIAEIDHIVPYSLSFDDSYQNKVLVRMGENRAKGNRLPLEYLRQCHPERVDSYLTMVGALVKNYKKKQRLLKETLTQEELEDWRERNLNDTKYISRFLLNFIHDHLAFAPSVTFSKRPVMAVNGSITGDLRKKWGVPKIRADGDLHHAADAAVIACVSDGMIQAITRYAQKRESALIQGRAIDRETGELPERGGHDALYDKEFPRPWPLFREELAARLSDDPREGIRPLNLNTYAQDETLKPVFVSRMPRRKVSGAAHMETIRSVKNAEKGCVISKMPLESLKLRDGEIEGYYNPKSDILLYEALRERLVLVGGDAKKAFVGGFHKPKSDGTPGPRVNKVKIQSKSSSNVMVLGGNGVAANGSMVRIDIFQREGKYYAVPIYVSDTVKKQLPSKAATVGKNADQWEQMNEQDFIFSLYPNDLIYVEHKSGFKLTKGKAEKIVKEGYLYYMGLGISTASISAESHDRAYAQPSLGIKTLKLLQKYEVDILGNISKVGKEKRMGFHERDG